MRAGMALAQDRRGRRLDGHDLDLRALGLQVLADARHGAAGADTRDEDVHIAVRILPDLRAGRRAVDRRVCRVDELAGDKAVRDLRGQLVGLRDRALHALCAVREDELRAIGLHDLAALDAHGLRHDDDDAVASGRGDGRQTDAGVAGGGLDDDGVRLEHAALLRVLDHGQRHTVFYGAGRVEVLELCQNTGFELLLFFNMRQLQKGRFTDQLVSGCIDLAHEMFLHLCIVIYLYVCLTRNGLACAQPPQQCQQMHKRPEMRFCIFIAYLLYMLIGLYRALPSMSIGKFISFLRKQNFL